jgi:hypothetical protein
VLAIAALAIATGDDATVGAAGTGLRLFGTRGEALAIAADGTRVAVATRLPRACDRVVVWREPTSAFTRFESRASCAGTVIHGYSEVAVAGRRTAWVETVGGNLLEMGLYVATTPTAKARRLAFAVNQQGAAGNVDGDWLGNLHGRGALLVFNTWRACGVGRPEGSPPCGTGLVTGGTVLSQQALWKVVGSKTVRIAAGPSSFPVVGLDGGRIAVLASDGSATIRNATGQVVATFPTAGTVGSTAAFQGGQLVVLAGTTLYAYDAASGSLLDRVPLPPGSGAPVLQDVDRGLAVVVRRSRVLVVQLATGRTATVALPGSAPFDAQLERAGLTASYNVPASTAHGRVTFLPRAELLRLLR